MPAWEPTPREPAAVCGEWKNVVRPVLLGAYDAVRLENRVAAPPAASGTAPRIIPADANCDAVGRTILETLEPRPFWKSCTESPVTPFATRAF